MRATNPIVGFSGESLRSERKGTLPVTIQDKKGVTITSPQEFYIINAPTKYNCILARKLLGDIIGIPSSFHQTILFIRENEKMGRARGCQRIARICNMIKLSEPTNRGPDEKKK